MNSFKTLGNDDIYSLKIWSFCSPISWTSWSIFLSGQNNLLMSCVSILSCSIKYGHFIAGREMYGIRSRFFNQFVNKSCVSKSSSGHDFVIPSSRTVSIEIFGLHPFWYQKPRCRWIFCYVSSRWYVISCNRITHI